MKKIMAMAVMMAVCEVVAGSSEIETEVVNGIEWSYEGSASIVEITGWRPVAADVKKDSVTTVIVPEKLSNKTVVNIDSAAFANCHGLESVVLPKGLSRIDSNAFMGCSRLRKINIPSKVENIDYSAFENCPMLGDGVVVVDGWVVALNGASPVHLKIPAGVRGVAACVFQGQSSILSVEIPDSVQYICSRAFEGCTGLGDGLVIANGWVLGYNGNIPENLIIPQGVKAVAGGRNMWPNLRSVSIPEGVVSIGHEAFKNCTTLEVVNFPHGLQMLCREAFENCNLRDIVLPENSVMVYPDAFAGNRSLQTVKFLGDPPKASYGNTLRHVFARYTEVFGYYPKSSKKWTKQLLEEAEQEWEMSMVPYDDGGAADPEQANSFLLAMTFGGLVKDADDVMVGIIQVTTARATKKGVKVGGFVMLADGKKQTLKAVTVPIENGKLILATKVGKIDMFLAITVDGFVGTFGEMTVASETISEDTGVLSGTLKLSYFDAKTGKIKTKSIKLVGVASGKEAVGDLAIRGESVKSFAADVE